MAENLRRKYTIVSWDQKFVVFPSAVCKTENGEYVIEDLSQEDTHYAFPQCNVFYVKEEPCDE